MTLFRAFVLAVALSSLPAWADGSAPDRKAMADESAIVITLCEDGGKTPAGRAMESFGRAALDPFVRRAYRTRTWLVGAQATPKAFLDALRGAAREHRAVDVLLFAHGSPGKTHLAGGVLTPAELVAGLKGRGGERLRMVYTTTCYSDTFLAAWSETGAWAVRGMKGVNRPLDFPRFFLGWLAGEDYQTANQAGLRMNESLHQAYNRLAPELRPRLARAREALGSYEPLTSAGESARTAAREALRMAGRWFAGPWDLEESRPILRGGEARIDRLPPAAAAAPAKSAPARQYH